MSTNLWRYMDISKFERLLISKALYFCSSKHFDDKFEGEYAWGPTGHKKYLDNIKKLAEVNGGGLDHHTFMLFHLKDIRDLSSKSYVSCWNKNYNECEAMWKLYCQDITKGIVIKSDTNKLQSVLSNSGKQIYFKPVRYEANFFVKKYNPEIEEMLYHKRTAFKFENEYRAFFTEREFSAKPQKGINISVNLSELITEIRISPFASKELKTELQDLLAKYELEIPVKSSEIKPFPLMSLIEEIVEEVPLPNGQSAQLFKVGLQQNSYD